MNAFGWVILVVLAVLVVMQLMRTNTVRFGSVDGRGQPVPVQSTGDPRAQNDAALGASIGNAVASVFGLINTVASNNAQR